MMLALDAAWGDGLHFHGAPSLAHTASQRLSPSPTGIGTEGPRGYRARGAED
jgi:hypothetical protein